MYEITYGSKHSKEMGTKECAAAIRAEIKAEIAAGNLPAGSYSVRMKRFAGGSSIDVSIADLPIIVLNRHRIAADLAGINTHRTNLPVYTEAGKAIHDRVEAIIQSYNYDGSEIQSDYFNVKFYGHASFGWEWEAAQRKAIEAQERANPSYTFEKDPSGDLRSWSATNQSATVEG